LAGAPPGALTKPPDSASETPATSGTKSISISPKETTRPGAAAAAGATPSPRGAIEQRKAGRNETEHERIKKMEHGGRDADEVLVDR
jgi:hypothetical protein